MRASVTRAVAAACLILLPQAAVRAAEEKSVEELARTIQKLKTESFEQNARETAMRSLARHDNLNAGKVLAACLDDPFVHIQELAVQLLGKMQNPDVAAYVSKTYLAHASPEVRANAAKALGLAGQAQAVDRLVAAVGDRDPAVGAEAARALALIKNASAVDGLGKRLGSLKGAAKGEALRTLGVIGHLPEEKKLEGLFKDSSWETRAGLLDALAAAHSPLLSGYARQARGDKSFCVRIAAVQALVAEAGGGPEARAAALEGLEAALGDDAWQVKAAAAHACVDLWDAGCIPLLVEALRREYGGGGGRLLIDLTLALQAYSGKNIGYDGDLWSSWWAAQKGKFTLGKEPKRNRYGVLEDLGTPQDEKTVVTFYSLPVLSKRVAFVFDFSGSMKKAASDAEDARPKIDLARDKMKETLGKFDKDQWFNVLIYRYYSGFPPKTEVQRAFPARLMPADDPRKKQAAEFLDGLDPLGWGNFFESVQAAMEIPEVDTVYFLSDGVPSRGRYVTKTGILEALKEANRFRQVMIHTVLTGEKGADESFMRDLAGSTWGLTTKG